MKTFKYTIIFSIFLVFNSCQFFDKKVPDKKELLQKELEKINWKEVDEFPSAFLCDSLADKELQKQCFFDNIIKNIQARIGVDTLQMLYPEIDTIDIRITINTDSTLKFEIEQPKNKVSYDIKKIDSILQKRLVNFPKIEPAIKRGVKVKSQFILPVIINVTE